MSENELEEILNQVKQRANANVPANPPVTDFGSSTGKTSTTPQIPSQPDIDFSVFSADSGRNNVNNDRPAMRDRDNRKPPKKSKKGLVIAIVAVLVVVIAVIGTCVALSGSKGTQEPVTDAPVVVEVEQVINPLTGEAGYNADALGKRPVAVVVENEYSTEAVRPQWGLNDADIVLEGESEFSTRLLLFWADYTDVPDMVGPARSARPPFIRFSQLFDSVFIHAGLSKSKGNYVGADTVFVTEDVDHINLLNLTEDGTYFGRNNERYTAVEHTGYLNGSNLPQLLAEADIDTTVDSAGFTQLKFNEEAASLSQAPATSCSFKWSGACPKNARFDYDSVSHKYVTTDFDSQYGKADASFTNLIFLFDETEYVVKEDYKNGQSETYCDYRLSGGNGTILSEGTALEITWGVTDGKLWMKTADGSDAVLNPGKTYIGYGSSNNGGSLQLNITNQSDTY